VKTTVTRILGWSAAACWLAAWFLPVVDNHPGWDAFYSTLTGPFRESSPTRGEDAVIHLLSASTNAVFVVLFAHWYLERLARPAMFLKVALACLLLNLYWPVQLLRVGELSGLLVGYYAWELSFALLVAIGVLSAVSARRTSRTPRADTPA
jgi:hypothetical protein